MTIKDTFALFIVAASTVTAGPTTAQSYPTKPIRLIVPFPPGGSTDILARILSQKLYDSLKQQVIVDNRPGAGGTLGSRIAMNATPDGYSLLLASTSTHAIGPSLYAKPPYNPMLDFTAITEVATSPIVLMAAASVPAASLKELIALAKTKPGQLNFGSSGIGTQFHLSGELLKLLAGINMVHVPYKGTALVYPDMFSGQIQVLFDLPSVALPFIKAGRVKALAVSGKIRAPVLPDLPTIAESGVPGYEADLWFGMWGPAKLPRALASQVQGELAHLMQAPEVKERFTGLGMDAVGSTPEQFTLFVAAEFAKWEKVVKASGARAD